MADHDPQPYDVGELSKRAGSLSLAEILLHAIYNAPAFMWFLAKHPSDLGLD
jgi:hypothetical protein